MSTTSRLQQTGLSLGGLGLAASGGVVIYVLIDVLLAFLRPDLSLLHRAESDYGVGPYSWLMDINFVLRGVLSLALAAALVRLAGGTERLRLGVWFLAAWGIGSALLAFFPDDPPGAPHTTAGAIHLLLALVAFLCVVVGTIALSIGLRHFPSLRQLAGLLLALAVVAIIPLALLGHTNFRPHTLDGLYERIFLGLELLWILIVGVACQRATVYHPRSATESP